MTSRPELVVPPKAKPGDRVAVLSPSWAGPGVFPEVHAIGMRVLRDELQLEPVEFPTTRTVDSSPEARAADLMAAFADPSIAAVVATIGGDDEITVLPYLDPAVFVANPKPFAGYSDNTNLLNWLWNHGIVGYHGGSTLVHLARPGGTHPVSLESLRRALFTPRPSTSRRSRASRTYTPTGRTCPPSRARRRRLRNPAGTGTTPTRS